MKGLYQILAEDYRDFQAHEPARKQAKQLIEANRPSKVKETLKESTNVNIDSMGNVNVSITEDMPIVAEPIEEVKEDTIEEACKEDKEVIKGSEEKDNKSLVKESDELGSGLLEVSYEDGTVIIGTESSSGAEYPCSTKEDLKKAFSEYVDNYVGYEDEEDMDESEEVAEEVAVTEEQPEIDLSIINSLSMVSAEDIMNKISEMPEEEVEGIKNNLRMIRDMINVICPIEEVEEIEEITEEPFEECEIASFKVTRIAPKFGVVMLEAQTKEGLKYITGKNFNESEKTLDDAEIATDKTAAANRFKSLLK